MALHFAKRPFSHFISTVSRFTSFIPPAFQSHIISSAYLNPQFSLHTNLTQNIPSFTNAHYNHRWVSSDTGFTLHGEAEEGDLPGGYSSDEHIYKSDEDLEVMNEGSGFNKVLSITKDLHSLPIEEARAALDDCGFIPSPNLVQKLLHRFQYDGKAAFRVFQWAGSQPEYSHTVSVYHTMISILGVHGKFDKGWGLIRKMHENAMVTRQTLMIMVKSYAAAHDAQKAIRTFHAMDKFKLAADYDDFLCLLRALCRNMFVEEAEELIHFNKKSYPLETKSFNVILYGWCNIFVDVYQVKRLWEEMSNLCIIPDASSYTTVICCYSKAGKFYDVVRLYDEMKKKGFAPNLKVYNAVIYVLSKERCIKEALNLFNRIREMGFHPNAITYTYLIYLLCRTWNPEEAYRYLDEMIMEGFVPTIEIYHAFFRFVETEGAICKLFDKIYKTGCAPTIETYIMSIRRCCSWSDYESAFKLWNDMEKHCFSANSSIHYLLLNGFLLNGKPEEACKCYREMKANGFSLEPKIDSIFESCNVGRKYSSFQHQWKLSEESLERQRRKYRATVHRRGGGIITKSDK